jgi:hypothetical protein
MSISVDQVTYSKVIRKFLYIPNPILRVVLLNYEWIILSNVTLESGTMTLSAHLDTFDKSNQIKIQHSSTGTMKGF